jgi:formylglycine-generating enzyme required for sulfatase activity
MAEASVQAALATTAAVPTQAPQPTRTATLLPIETPAPNIPPGTVRIPAGSFTMGGDADTALAVCQKYVSNCSRDWYVNEEPPHAVSLDAFTLDAYEVTNAQFAAFLNAQGNQQEGGASWLEFDSDYVKIHQVSGTWQADSGYANHPVVEVSWYGAQAYCEWTGGRLPTEAEWEYAARGGLEGKQYPWGDGLDGSLVNFCDSNCEYDWADKTTNDGFARTAPVGSFQQNGYGLYDMAGNVWEWVSSLYQSYPYNAEDGREDLSASGSRVLRGGSWGDVPYNLCVAYRLDLDPALGSCFFGFRCAFSP